MLDVWKKSQKCEINTKRYRERQLRIEGGLNFPHKFQGFFKSHFHNTRREALRGIRSLKSRPQVRARLPICDAPQVLLCPQSTYICTSNLYLQHTTTHNNGKQQPNNHLPKSFLPPHSNQHPLHTPPSLPRLPHKPSLQRRCPPAENNRRCAPQAQCDTEETQSTGVWTAGYTTCCGAD